MEKKLHMVEIILLCNYTIGVASRALTNQFRSLKERGAGYAEEGQLRSY